MSLPISHLGDTYNEDVRALLRNNVPDVAQILKKELHPQAFRENVKFVLTSDARAKAGKTYYTRRPTPSQEAKYGGAPVWRYDIASIVEGTVLPSGIYYEETYNEVFIGGYPTYNLPRGYGADVYDNAFDTKWFDSIGMYKQPGDSIYPKLQGYNVFATPYVLEGFASYLTKLNWRLRLLIDGSLSTLIDKFVITENPESEAVEKNGTYHLYEQTKDVLFKTGKQYYRRSKIGYYSVTVEIGKHVRTSVGYERPGELKFIANKEYYRRVEDPHSLSGYKYSALIENRHYHVGDNIPGDTYTLSYGVYELPSEETYLEGKEYYAKTTDPHVSGGYKYVLLTAGVDYTIGHEIDRSDVRVIYYTGYNNYYECQNLTYPEYFLRTKETDSTTPEPCRYYMPVPSESVVRNGIPYYYYDSKHNDFIRCSMHPTEGYTYYTYDFDIGTGAYNYHQIDFTLPENKQPDAFADRAIYRREFGEYYCVGKNSGCGCIFIGATKNNSYSEGSTWKASKLFVELGEGSDLDVTDGGVVKHLYVDPANEDICRIKNLINLFLTRYRTILLSTGRKVVKYTPLKDDVAYTTEDLIERINAIVTSMGYYPSSPKYIEPISHRDATGEVYNLHTEYYLKKGFGDYFLIEDNDLIKTSTVESQTIISQGSEQTALKAKYPDYTDYTVYIQAYTARDMKLVINQIIDYIVNESYYLNVFKESSEFKQNLLTFEEDLWKHRGLSKMLYDMATKSDLPDIQRNYNDRWYFYDPSLPYVDSVFTQIDFKELSTTEAVGSIKQEPVDTTVEPATYGGYYVYANANIGWVPLCYVANVYNIADVWSNCNYSGCMQILNLTLHMLQSCTPEGVSWKEGIHNPRTSVTAEFKETMEDVLAQIERVEDMISLLLEYSPHVADIVVDIGYHVTTQFKMTMEDTIPLREKADTYVAGKVYCYYSTMQKKYVGVYPPITSAAAFDAKKLEHGTLYTWNFYHNKK